uniref:Transmembrane protein n=1 Tax=Caenorhabditis tropicalis TaxID=1561998 RepID=A0A1I7T1X8_9PELO
MDGHIKDCAIDKVQFREYRGEERVQKRAQLMYLLSMVISFSSPLHALFYFRKEICIQLYVVQFRDILLGIQKKCS